jgi:hypothetical protein
LASRIQFHEPDMPFISYKFFDFRLGDRYGKAERLQWNRADLGLNSPKSFDALIFGYYEGNQLCMREERGTASRRLSDSNRIGSSAGLESPNCPFLNLPEKRSGRWGQGLTAEKIKECHWLYKV